MSVVKGKQGSFSTGNSKLKKEMILLINGLNGVNDLRRGSGTIVAGDNVRIDMQGTTSTGQYNIQAQVGNRSIAGVLLAASGGSLNDVATGLTNSYNDGYFYVVS